MNRIKSQHGDFEDWFALGLGVPNLFRIDVFKSLPLPSAENLAGIVITGSPAMVSSREDWSERTADWLALAVQKDIPVLGVCYGHQLLAHALGGCAGPNPAGRQIGTVTAKLVNRSSNDRLLRHLPHTFPVQTSHSEVVLELPPGAERLATSPLDENFAIRFAENAWGVQFHPEFSRPVMSEYINCRSKALLKEGLDPEQLLRQITDTSEAKSVLSTFVNLIRVKG